MGQDNPPPPPQTPKYTVIFTLHVQFLSLFFFPFHFLFLFPLPFFTFFLVFSFPFHVPLQIAPSDIPHPPPALPVGGVFSPSNWSSPSMFVSCVPGWQCTEMFRRRERKSNLNLVQRPEEVGAPA